MESLTEDLYSPRRPSISMANLAQTSEYIEDSFKLPAARVKSLPVSLAIEQDIDLGETEEDTESHYTAHDETPSPIRKPTVPTIHLLPPDVQTSLHPPHPERGTPIPPRKNSKQNPHRTLSERRRNASQTDSLSSGKAIELVKRMKTPPRSPKLRRISPKASRKSKGSPNSLRREENSRSKLLDGNSSSGESDSQHLPLVRQSLRDSNEALSVSHGSPLERTRIEEKDEALISWDSDDQTTASGLADDSEKRTDDKFNDSIDRTLNDDAETNPRRRSPHQRRDIHVNNGGERRSDSSKL
ncbi:hypothetical protein BSL78_23529 [Apostichopus japonicus]|uniref:Uncharacterized protein n=1 Tax=Stichopus japonicus TaxID=307972 RepID=A0A2G8JV36_STIJA|nr:hypothetical protein BSL78_23529 [Apostichopus japonicus]